MTITNTLLYLPHQSKRSSKSEKAESDTQSINILPFAEDTVSRKFVMTLRRHLLLHIAHLSTTTTYHALVLFKQKEKLTKGSASKSDKYEVDTEPTYNLPFQKGKSKKEGESAKGSASKSSKESASPTTEQPGRLFVSFILFEYIYSLFI